MNQRQDVMIKDLLRNLHPQSADGGQGEAAKAAYARGILVATVGMIQAWETSFNFEQAIKAAAERAPREVVAGCCPATWCESFGMPESNGVVRRNGPAHK